MPSKKPELIRFLWWHGDFGGKDLILVRIYIQGRWLVYLEKSRRNDLL